MLPLRAWPVLSRPKFLRVSIIIDMPIGEADLGRQRRILAFCVLSALESAVETQNLRAGLGCSATLQAIGND